jgi:ornithine cyclodeaminase/alanine dehydrogenase-like protein (mu-crystallin family)
MSPTTLLLDRREVAELLSLETCIDVVEEAFRLLGRKEISPAALLSMHAGAGAFHVKAALFPHGGRQFFAAKCNANFSANSERFGLPAIQGLIILCDAECGYPLAVMDSIEITTLRTGAATAVAAKYLARADSRAATICGCGNQGRVQLRAVKRVLPIDHAFALDQDFAKATGFARELGAELRITIEPVTDLRQALKSSDVCVTCTPSRQALEPADCNRAGTFIAAIGADSPEKQELDPGLMTLGQVVVDSLDQCAVMGELHHCLVAKLLTREDVYAELGEIVAGIRRGRVSDDAITIFDSTGTAIQDAAAAIEVYGAALKRGDLPRMNFHP